MDEPWEDALPWWRRKRFLYAFVGLALLVWVIALRSPPKVWAPGVMVVEAPIQEDTESDPWMMENGVEVRPLARYTIQARVLGRKDYRDDISPMDLALGWGQMSDEKVLEKLDISQSNRWYLYRWKNHPPIPVGDIIEQSANVHLIPSSKAIEEKMEGIEEGDWVELEGELVALKKPNGWRWRSSLTRKDSGDGACELMWVKGIEIRPSPPLKR